MMDDIERKQLVCYERVQECTSNGIDTRELSGKREQDQKQPRTDGSK